MYRYLALGLCLVLFPAVTALAQDGESEPTQLSGMSIVGNDEAPKSLYIVPWKSSEIGVESSMNRMFDESDVPVDRDVFMRRLDFYEVRTANQNNRGRTN